MIYVLRVRNRRRIVALGQRYCNRRDQWADESFSHLSLGFVEAIKSCQDLQHAVADIAAILCIRSLSVCCISTIRLWITLNTRVVNYNYTLVIHW